MGVFSDWGTKTEDSSGITIEKGKRVRKLKTKRTSAGKSEKQFSMGEKGTIISSEKVKYGTRHKPETESAFSYTHKEPKGVVTGSETYGERHEAYDVPLHSGNVSGIEFKSKKKPLFGEEHQLTSNEREVKEYLKKEKKRIRDIEKHKEKEEKIRTQRKKYVAKHKKETRKALGFNRKSPLAKLIRRKIRF
jgi:hypothetical protein